MSAYNAEKFIAKAIQSILGQTYTHFEFIIINDGSTDKTRKIIKSFTDKRIVFFDKEKNQGLVSALNDGLDIAKGDYIARMDADDESLPQRFELQIEFMQNNPDIDVLGTALFFNHNNKSEISTQPTLHTECIRELIKGGVCIWHPTAFIKKSALGNIRYNEKYEAAEDYKLWVDLAKNGAQFANLQTPLLQYNWHGGNIGLTKQKIQHDNAKKINAEYLTYLCGGKFKKEFDLLLSDDSTMSFQALNVFYNQLNKNQKKLFRRHFRVYIRKNIHAMRYKIGAGMRGGGGLFIYYLRYKVKSYLNIK